MNDPDYQERLAEWERIPTPDELDDMLFEASRPGLMLSKTRLPDDPGAPGSWLGGRPTLPPEIDWPWFAPEDTPLVPMHFVAQIDLAQVPRMNGLPEIPRTGTLFFFFDPILAPVRGLGFGGARVIHVDRDVSGYAPREMPKIPGSLDPDEMSFWYTENPTHGYRRWNFTYLAFTGYRQDLYPNNAFQMAVAEANLDVKDDLIERTAERREGWEEHRSQSFAPHHMFGSTGRLEPVGELTRILAMRGDSDLGLDYGNGDWIVFWVPDGDLAMNNFDNVQIFEETQ